MAVRRVYVEKKYGFDVEASKLFAEITENLLVKGLTKVRIIHRYDIEGITDRDYEESKITVFSEPPVDNLYEENLVIPRNRSGYCIEYLPGQYDQRADSAAQCIRLLHTGKDPMSKWQNL